jgi:hypothetical protein
MRTVLRHGLHRKLAGYQGRMQLPYECRLISGYGIEAGSIEKRVRFVGPGECFPGANGSIILHEHRSVQFPEFDNKTEQIDRLAFGQRIEQTIRHQRSRILDVNNIGFVDRYFAIVG